MSNDSIINHILESKDAKMITGENIKIATKFFISYKIEMTCLRNAEAGEELKIGEDISLELRTQKQFQPYINNLIDRISYLLQSSDFDNNLKEKWWFYSKLKLLIVDNVNVDKKIFIQNPKLTVQAKATRAINAKEEITNKDINDIQDALFDEEGVDLSKIDLNSQMYFVSIENNIAYIFVDFNIDKNLTLNSNKDNITKILRYQIWHNLYFENRYNILDNWFPFLEIISDVNNNTYDDFEGFILEKITDDRINEIKGKWTNNTLFKERIQIINQGIDAFFREEYCNCISNLVCQIEGILRDSYSQSKTQKMSQINAFIEDLINKAKIKSNQCEDHLFFWNQFKNFLSKDGFFQGFNETDINHNFSRHTVAHGKLKYEQFSRLEAIKTILTLDQVYNYIV